MDPFSGSGTTCAVAQELGRRSVGLDLSLDYSSMAANRKGPVSLPMMLGELLESNGMSKLTYLSLGWGVQSWTIAAMVALGELPPIDLAIHTDTYPRGGRNLRPRCRVDSLAGRTWRQCGDRDRREYRGFAGLGQRRSVMIPAFSVAQDGSHGQIKRQCTHDWKLAPIRRHLPQLIPNPKPGAVECWQGISLDEWHRMRNSDVKYIRNVYPLVDQRMTRRDCVSWLLARGLDVPPKSACTFCPYHSLGHWKEMKVEGIESRRN